MKGLTAQEWADSMKKLDTTGDEIALHVLCRMYNHHCMVYTKMNIWSTVGTDVPIPEETLIGMCDIRLLFIETDVFGELQKIPFAPAPGKQLYGDARTGLPPLPDGNNNNVSPPLNLSVVTSTASTPVASNLKSSEHDIAATGDNATVNNADATGDSHEEQKEPEHSSPIESGAKPYVNEGHATPQ